MKLIAVSMDAKTIAAQKSLGFFFQEKVTESSVRSILTEGSLG